MFSTIYTLLKTRLYSSTSSPLQSSGLIFQTYIYIVPANAHLAGAAVVATHRRCVKTGGDTRPPGKNELYINPFGASPYT